jgi:hypothetical protein
VQRDTERKAFDAQLEALRRLGPEGRMRVAAEMSEDARRIAVEGELRRRPDLGEREARLAVLRRAWGPELASRVERASAHRR